MSKIALRIENLSKQYRIGLHRERHDTLRDQITYGLRNIFRRNGKARQDTEAFWALSDVSFEVKEGDVLGIIGRNGAGKSTLLKILSRITEPTAGQVSIFGRVGSLLEVGTGFHGELSGRENIYLNGAILGMKKTEIDRKFDEIVAFSEIDKFLDTPVKRYSSGMYIRLAFAVAAHLEPEVLIVDEVLAVGDAGFQKKCLGKMEGVAREGRTVLFVSHNMVAVEHLCNKALMLNAGKVTFTGNPKEAASFYLASFAGTNGTGETSVVDLREAPGRPKKFRPHLDRFELLSEGGKPVHGGIKIGSPLRACISFHLEKPATEVHLQLSFDNDLGQRIFVAATTLQAGWQDVRKSGEHKFICDMPNLMLVPGGYRIKILLDINGTLVDCVWDAARLTVLDSNYFGTGRWVPDSGFLVMRQEWRRE